MVGLCRKHLRPACPVPLWISPQQVGGITDYILPKTQSAQPSPCILRRAVDIFGSPGIKIISQVKEITKRQFLVLDITHIYNPGFAHAVIICHPHLFPYLCKRTRVDPQIGNRSPVVIKMIVHPVAARMILRFLSRKSPHIAKIIIAEHQNIVL